MSFDMGYLKGKDKKRALQESMAHKGTVNGLAFTNTGKYVVRNLYKNQLVAADKSAVCLQFCSIFKVTNSLPLGHLTEEFGNGT